MGVACDFRRNALLALVARHNLSQRRLKRRRRRLHNAWWGQPEKLLQQHFVEFHLARTRQKQIEI